VSTSTLHRSRADVAARLRGRRPEIEQAILTRVNAVAEPNETADSEYLDGLMAAFGAALDYGLAAVELGEETTPPPPALLAQARLAARDGVSLDMVLRRYFAGYTLLGDFLIEEAGKDEMMSGADLQRLLRAQANLFDRLIAAVSEEYVREAGSRRGSVDQRRTERVRRLLDGELLDTAGLGYDFAAFHIGLIATGPGAERAVRGLAAALDRRPLIVRPDDCTIWAWLGGRQRIGTEKALDRAGKDWPKEASLAIGEPVRGLSGWRTTHRQAKAALPIAVRDSEHVVRYADVALLATALKDDLLARTLEDLYLNPLALEPDGGTTLRRTLHDYFGASRNISSTAAALGVSRQTVSSRLRAIEDRIGAPIDTCAAELETAVRLRHLSDRQIR
jgi:GGDEF-like domain/PucR C-terminal helix-turn-helix domain